MKGPIFLWTVLRAKRVRGTDLRAVQSLLQQAPEIFWLAEIDEAAQSPIRIGGCRIDEDAGLGAIALSIGIDSLANTRGVVAAFQRELTDQQVRERVEHGVANAWITVTRVEMP